MRLQEDLDFTTLSWVKAELDETLRQARHALEAYVEDPTDASQMRFCATYLHQVQGTLRMVELYGAAMVAEEMEQLAMALLGDGIGDRDEAYTVLMRGIVQLPDYLERLQTGYKDIPIVLLPLLNDLRAARGEKGLSESVLFTPDLGRPLPSGASGPVEPLPDIDLRRQASALRAQFQLSLLKWFRGEDVPLHGARLAQICERLVAMVSQEDGRRLFWVAGGLLEAMHDGAFEPNQQLKQTIGRVEREIKRLGEAGEATFRLDPPRELTRNLLYFVAHAPADHGRLVELRRVFDLASLLPSEQELEHARGSISGHNRALLDTVAIGIKDDLLRVKDALDLHMRTQSTDVAALAAQAEVLTRVADTLGMLGLGVPRRVVIEQRDAVQQMAGAERPADEASLLDVAGALLYVEASLDDQVQHLGAAPAASGATVAGLPQAEARRVLETVVKEAQANFAQAKQCFVAFVESNWDHAQLDDVPRLLDEVAGALRILELDEPPRYLVAVRCFTERELLDRRRVPNGQQMDTLADALASLEYYLEALRDQRPGRDRIVDVTRQRLETLGYWPIPADGSELRAAADESATTVATAFPTTAPITAAAAFATVAPIATSEPVTTGPAAIDATSEPAVDAGTESLPADAFSVPADESSVAEPEAPASTAVEAGPADGPVAEPITVETPASMQQPGGPAAAAPAVSLGFEGGGEDIDEEIREVFIEEVQEEIANLDELMPRWSAHPDHLDSLKPIRRVFHTLKGSGRLVGALTLGEFSWKVENMLNRVLDQTIAPTPAVVALVAAAQQALPQLLAALRGEDGVTADLEQIKDVADRLSAGEQAQLVASAAPAVTPARDAAERAPEPVPESAPDSVIEPALPSEMAEPSDFAPATDHPLEADTAVDAGTELDAFASAESDIAELVEDITPQAADADADADADIEAGIEAPELAIELTSEPASEPTTVPASEPVPALQIGERTPFSIDTVLFDILKVEVAGHLETVDAFVGDSLVQPQPASDPLLRAVHTMAGAFAMTEVPHISDVVGPAEGYIKRLLALHGAPSSDGVRLLGQMADAVRHLIDTLDGDAPYAPEFPLLAEALAALRDTLPEPTGPLLPMHTEPEPELPVADEAAPTSVDAAVPTDSDSIGDGAQTDAVEPSSSDSDAVALDPTAVELEAFEGSDGDRLALEAAVAEFDSGFAEMPTIEIADMPVADEAVGPAMAVDESLTSAFGDIESAAPVDAEAGSDIPLETVAVESEASDQATSDAAIDLAGIDVEEIDLESLADLPFELDVSTETVATADEESDTAVSSDAIGIELDSIDAAVGSDEHAGRSDELSIEFDAALAGDASAAPADMVELASEGFDGAGIAAPTESPASIDPGADLDTLETELLDFADAADEPAGLEIVDIDDLGPQHAMPSSASWETADHEHDHEAESLVALLLQEEGQPGAETPAGDAPSASESAIADAAEPIADANAFEIVESDTADTGAIETTEAETLESEALEAEAIEAEAIEAEALEAEALEAEALEAEALEAEAIEAEAIEAEAIEAEAIEAEAIEAEAIEAEAIEAEAIEAEAIEAEAIEAEAIEAEAIEAEAIEAEAIEAEAIEARAIEAEATEAELIVAALDAPAPVVESADMGTTAAPAVPSVMPSVAPGAGGLAALSGELDPDPDGPLELADLDEELLDIFLEEGVDILDHSDGLLAKLRENPADRELVVGLQRDLHTLKGGARMAGIAPIGDLGHAMESLLEAVAEGKRELRADALEVLERSFDRLHGMVTRVGERRALAMPQTLVACVDALVRGEALPLPGAAPAPVATPLVDRLPQPPLIDEVEEDEPAVRAPQEQIRIRADLLDRLVNYAGEVAIYRARLEQQLGAFRGSLSEMEQTTSRLREQLRRLEIETEAQIIARYQREGEEANQDFDPLELDRFSTQQQLSRALSESAADLSNLQGTLDDLTRQYETLLLQQSRVSSELQEGLMRTRMVPFDALVPRLRRILRQTASELGRKAQLKVDGAQGEMDRSVLDRMTAPLEHILRNSIAHGLESPEERIAAGKPEEGTVRITVAREGSEVVIRAADDGRGLNREAIRRKAIERGLLDPAVQLPDRELYAFILGSGFSTAEKLSKIAGRGVGMDVVASEIKQLGGSLHIESESGRGTEFVIRLPFTLAVTQAVFVKINDTQFAVPISSVQGVSRIPPAELQAQLDGSDPQFEYAGENYAIHDLGLLLGQTNVRASESLQVPLLLARSGDLRAAICVDQVIGSREIVVKPTGPQVNSIPGIFGATVMGDGSVVVILDLAPLVRRAVAHRLAGEAPPQMAEIEQRRIPLVMVVDDSITMRKVTGRVLERSGYEVMTAKDGVDAIEKLQERVPDVMLLDIEMPRMDGYELATHMRNDVRLRGIPIIMITSRTGEKHRQRAFEIGVDRYLGKPYQEAELMRNVSDILKVGRD